MNGREFKAEGVGSGGIQDGGKCAKARKLGRGTRRCGAGCDSAGTGEGFSLLRRVPRPRCRWVERAAGAESRFRWASRPRRRADGSWDRRLREGWEALHALSAENDAFLTRRWCRERPRVLADPNGARFY